MPSLEQIRGVGDFTTLYRWLISIPSLPAGVIGDVEILNILCESTDLPNKINTPREIRLHGQKIKVPGISEPTGTLNMTFTETVDNPVSDFITSWRQLVWEDNTGFQAIAEDLKADIIIQRFDQLDNPIYEYVLLGAWPETHEAGGTLDGQTPDPLKPIVTWSYDDYSERSL